MTKEHQHEDCNCKNTSEGCGCGEDHNHEHNHEEMPMLHLTLDDGLEMDCFVVGDFEVEEKAYLALLPEDDERVLLYEYKEDEAGIELINIEDDEEFELVSEAFYALYNDEESEDDEA